MGWRTDRMVDRPPSPAMAALAHRRLARVGAHLVPSPVAGSSTGRFTGQVCVVTGAAGGIGLGVAERLCSEGARALCILDAGDASQAIAKLKQVAPAAEIFAVRLDLTKAAEVQQAFSDIIGKMGRVDVLVQAAGITGQVNLKTHEVDEADFDRVFEVNVKALFLGARAVLPTMLQTGYGRIVNIASISGKDGNAGMLAYSSSKAAVINLTKVMGKDYATSGKDIAINCIAPAVVQTAMVDAMPPEQVKYMTDKIPMGRTCRLDEVASTVAFAASPEWSFTTGFCFDCTGGRAVY
mmetsp:Transcript_88466/g.283818  ORF Transcript_88466/g.283818 Transcript_88466/m.283818 type:complete len:295 (+) Transcript_88466:23-907(+)